MVTCEKCGGLFEKKDCHPVFEDYLCPTCYEMWIDYFMDRFGKKADEASATDGELLPGERGEGVVN